MSGRRRNLLANLALAVASVGVMPLGAEFNQDGRRNHGWTPAQIADPSSILYVGDSFALGNGLADADIIPTHLEALLAKQARSTR